MADPIRLEGNTPEAIEFLKHWCPRGIWLLTAIAPDSGETKTKGLRSDQENEVAAFLAFQHGKCNVYFSVNDVDKIHSKKVKKTDIVAVRALHVDVDPPKDGGDIAEAQASILAKLRAFEPVPFAGRHPV